MDDPGSTTGLGPAELREALASPDATVRAGAVRRARAEAGNLPLLIGALGDRDVEVRRMAVRALARTPHAASARALTRASSEDPSVAVRAEAVAAVGRILERRLRS